MPLYDYECQTCSTEFTETNAIEDRAKQRCPRCGMKAKQIIKEVHVGASVFQPGWFRDLGPEPVYVETPQQLREECDKRGKLSGYLENGVWRTYPGPDYDPKEAARRKQAESERETELLERRLGLSGD